MTQCNRNAGGPFRPCVSPFVAVHHDLAVPPHRWPVAGGLMPWARAARIAATDRVSSGAEPEHHDSRQGRIAPDDPALEAEHEQHQPGSRTASRAPFGVDPGAVGRGQLVVVENVSGVPRMAC